MSRVLLNFSFQLTGILRFSEIFSNKLNFNSRKGFHVLNRNFAKRNDDGTTLPVPNIFAHAEDKTKQNFIDVLHKFKIREQNRRGHVEFIRAALKYMEEYGVERDLEVYRALVDVMPKGKFVPQNILQAEFMHYPKQQDCILELLEKMEYNRVIPDPEFGELLINIFGERGYPVRKFMRMLYWMPKFKNLSPWPVPDNLPKEPFDLAMLAIKRITSVDPITKISVFSTRTVEDAVDDTWIISGQSEEQKELLNLHPSDKPVYIEGAFRIWLRDVSVFYFVLRGKANKKEEIKNDVDLDDVSHIKVSYFTPPISEVAKVPSVHEQEDGTYYAVCATGSSSRDSLLSWIRLLQRENPRLLEVPVLFTLRSPTTDLVEVNKKSKGNNSSNNMDISRSASSVKDSDKG